MTNLAGGLEGVRNFSAEMGTVPRKPEQEGLGQEPGDPAFSQRLYSLEGRGDRLVQGTKARSHTPAPSQDSPRGGLRLGRGRPRARRTQGRPGEPEGPGVGTPRRHKEAGRGSFENAEEADLGRGPGSDDEGGSARPRAGGGGRRGARGAGRPQPRRPPAGSARAAAAAAGWAAWRPPEATPRTLPSARRLRSPALERAALRAASGCRPKTRRLHWGPVRSSSRRPGVPPRPRQRDHER